MKGTFQPNLFHRLGNAWNAMKGLPIEPGALFPPPRSSSTGWINWQGWDEFEKQARSDGERDKQNARTAVTSPWVYADVQAIANEFSTAELVVKERKAAKLEDVENHDLELLWESPNEHMGRSFVTAFWAWSYVLTSKAYLYWVPDTTGTRIEEVWPIPPFMIRAIPDPKEFIRGYAFKSRSDADALFIPSEYVTYSHSVNLFDARDGLSFLVAAMTEINADLAASEWNLNFFDDNNGLPDGFMGVSENTLDVDLERIRLELRDWFGGAKRGIAVGRSGDLKYTQFGRSQKDMEFSQGREFASKIIGRTLGFPDGYWSDLANRANAEQARKTMISGAVWPLLVRLAEDMNAKRRGVVQRWYGEEYRVVFKDIRPEDRQLFLQEQAARKDYWLINELREADGKDPIEDVRGLMLIAEINKGAPTPGSEPAQELEDEASAKAEAEAQKQAAAIEAGEQPPPEEAPPEAEAAPVSEEAIAEPTDAETPPEADGGMNVFSKATDLDRWERKAIKRLKDKGSAAAPFASDAIDADTHARISDALHQATTPDAVKAVFADVDTLLDEVDDAAREWAEKALEGDDG